jgi:hypothetical protein
MNDFTLKLKGREFVLNSGVVFISLGTVRLTDLLTMGLVPVPGSRGRWVWG